MRTPASRLDPDRKNKNKTLLCGPKHYFTIKLNERVNFTDVGATVTGWPSRGGLIVLEDATHVDFVFLGLSTMDPPMKAFAAEGDGKFAGDLEFMLVIEEHRKMTTNSGKQRKLRP